jgi:hypothetical protein
MKFGDKAFFIQIHIMESSTSYSAELKENNERGKFREATVDLIAGSLGKTKICVFIGYYVIQLLF